MFHNYLGFFFVLICVACNSQANHSEEAHRSIDASMFEHKFIATDLPGETDWGYGCSALADFDGDGDLDYAMSGKEGLYWFENKDGDSWERHPVGVMPLRHLGATAFDVDEDGWQDIIIGGFWYRNPQDPRNVSFERHQFDEIETNIHDIVMADMDGDGSKDVVMTGEGEGTHWYQIPKAPTDQEEWKKTEITLDPMPDRDHIHAGFFPAGVNDLDGDGDNDLVLPDRWLENGSQGQEWKRHTLPFGKRGPFGLSSRSWIIDLDEDGDQDIVMTDCDQVASRAAWLENDGNVPPAFTTHFLPNTAPGIRGSFHSLFVGDLDLDGDVDIFTCDQEDDTIFPENATPRWYVWENVSKDGHILFTERVIFDGKLGGHDALVGDADGDGDLDIFSKVWNLWPGNANEGREHVDFFENKIR